MSFDFTVERNSTKWVLGAEGVLTEYIADAPAIEFNADGSYKGVLVEPQSVNEALQSEDLDNATYWTVFRATIATDTETDPKGGTNSFLLSETVDNLSHGFVTASAQRPSITSGETWTQSIFVKKGDGANAPDIIQLSFGDSLFTAGNYANFDISVGGGTSGTVTASSGGTGRIRYYGNGWYRISFTATSTGAGGNAIIVIFTNDNPTATQAPAYAGQTDANVFIWGAQLEESPIATSYIPTTTGAVTRVKDDIYLTSASSLIGQTEGTMFVEVDWQDSGADQVLFNISDDTSANVIRLIRVNSTNEIKVALQESGGPSEVFIGTSSSAFTGIYKFSFAYKTSDSKLFVNGAEEASSTATLSGFSSTISYIDFGQAQNTTAQANMWIRAVALYTTRLSDAECEALTS